MRKRIARQRGLSLLETLMLVTILAIIGGSTGQTLIAVTKVSRQADNSLRDETSLVSKMEQMRSVDFASLPIGTAVSPYSDGALQVDIGLADPTGGGSADARWKQITVRLASGRQLVTTVCQP